MRRSRRSKPRNSRAVSENVVAMYGSGVGRPVDTGRGVREQCPPYLVLPRKCFIEHITKTKTLPP